MAYRRRQHFDLAYRRDAGPGRWKVWWDSEGGWGYAQMHGYIGLGMLFVNAL